MKSPGQPGEATKESAKAPDARRPRFQLLERTPLNVIAYKLTGFGATRVIERSGQDLGPLLPGLREKGHVLDLTTLPTRDLVVANLGAPTLDLSLKRGEVYQPRFPEDVNLSGLQGITLKIAEASLRDPTYGGLDSVSLSGYVAYWRARGARVGRKIAGRLVWFRRKA